MSNLVLMYLQRKQRFYNTMLDVLKVNASNENQHEIERFQLLYDEYDDIINDVGVLVKRGLADKETLDKFKELRDVVQVFVTNFRKDEELTQQEIDEWYDFNELLSALSAVREYE